MMTLEDFKAARSVLAGVIADTHLVHSVAFSKATGNHVYIKPENMQVTGAYKIRGAYYKISTLTPEEKARGLITASAGNHAQGVAYAAQAAGVKATVVMPTTTPLVKVNNTKDYGANVILHGAVFDDAAELASQLAEAEGYTYIHPFNDPILATGQGTIAYEIFSDLPEVDIILVPVGGGGLAAGVASLAMWSAWTGWRPSRTAWPSRPLGTRFSHMCSRIWTASSPSRTGSWWMPSWI